MDCDYLQGYLFSKPIAAEALALLVQAKQPSRTSTNETTAVASA